MGTSLHISGAEGNRARRRWLILPAGVWLVGALVQSFMLRIPLSGDLYSFRQAQTALVVREFMQTGFDWRTPLPVFGAGSFVPMEFPLFQGFAGLVGTILQVDPAVATRLGGLVFFQVSALVTFVLLVRWFSRTAAVAGLILFEFTSFGLYWGHSALIDFLPVALMLAGTLLADLSLASRDDKRRVLLATGTGILVVLAFLSKSTTGPILTLLLFVPVMNAWSQMESRERMRAVAVPSLSVLVALVAAGVWTRVADEVKAADPWTAWLTSSALAGWNYGTLGQRLSPTTWLEIVHGYWGAILGGSIVLLGVTVIAIVGWKWKPAVIVLAVSPWIGPLLFINLYWVHSYYSIAVFPLLVMLGAAAIAVVVGPFAHKRDRFLVGAGAVVAVILVTWLSGEGAKYAANLASPHGPPPLATSLNAITQPDDGVILFNCDWDPTVPFYAERNALMVTTQSSVLPSPADLEGFTHAAFCTEPAAGYDSALRSGLPTGSHWEAVSPGIFSIHGQSA